MGGVPIHLQFRPIEVYQFNKWTGKPIFNEKSSIPQGHNIDRRHNEKSSAR